MQFINKHIKDAKEDVIVIPVNCENKLTSLQRTLGDKYPSFIKEYRKYAKGKFTKKDLHGSVQYIVDYTHKKVLINAFCNYYKKKSKIDTEAYKMCLMQIAHKCHVPIAIPNSLFYCTKDGYEKAKEIAEQFLKDREVYVYKGEKNEG